MQVKMFCGNNKIVLEDEINDWLKESQKFPSFKIWCITQSQEATIDVQIGYVFIAIWYIL